MARKFSPEVKIHSACRGMLAHVKPSYLHSLLVLGIFGATISCSSKTGDVFDPHMTTLSASDLKGACFSLYPKQDFVTTRIGLAIRLRIDMLPKPTCFVNGTGISQDINIRLGTLPAYWDVKFVGSTKIHAGRSYGSIYLDIQPNRGAHGSDDWHKIEVLSDSPEVEKTSFIVAPLIRQRVLDAGEQFSGALVADIMLGTRRLFAWGDDTDRQSSVRYDNITQISLGKSHGLAIQENGQIVSWGQFGAGLQIIPDDTRPTPTDPLLKITAIAAGSDHSMALRSDGRVVAWGANSYGQTTVPASAGSNIVDIEAGNAYSLALTSTGQVIAWGKNDAGQINVPPQAQSDVVAMAAGVGHVLALKSNGRVIAWGNNSFHQIDVPADATGIVAIAAGDHHSVALNANGRVFAWGKNDAGQVSLELGGHPLTDIRAIAAGGNHTLVLLQRAGSMYGSPLAFGQNNKGQASIPVPSPLVYNIQKPMF